MKNLRIKIPLILFLSLLSIISYAQSWSFIKPNERYHFKRTGDTIPLNTILIDSAAFVGSDSVFYLNRLFLPCDTCSSEGFYLDNQPGFLQREFILSQVSSTVQLINPEKYTIHLPDNNEKVWWFDEAKTQKATLESTIVEEVFGIEDSVSTININGEPQIRIAKNLGLLRYFDYELSGLEYAGLGKCLPEWKDFYNFKVGDVFQYYSHINRFGDIPPDEYNLNKYTVTAIVKNSDSIIIEWNKVGLNTHYLDYEMNSDNSQIDFSTIKTQEAEKNTESGSWVITKNSIANSYHNQLLHVKIEKWFGVMEDYVPAQFKMMNEVISLNNGNHFSMHEDSLFYFEDFGVHAIINFEFKASLGKVYFIVSDYKADWFEIEQLIGYIKNGIDTTGVVFDDDYSTVFDTNTINNKQLLDLMIKAYPNPSMGEITFDLGTENKANIKIYTLEGRLVEQFETKSNQTQHLHHLNSGIYIISIQLKEGLQQLKWIKE